MALLVVLTLTAKVKYTSGDSQLTLLTSQSIIENGSINLKSYREALGNLNFSEGNWKYIDNEEEGKVYYMYPLGAPLFSVPIVFVAQKFGLNMAVLEHDALLQKLIACTLLILIFYVHYKIALLFFENNQAVIISLLFFLGTSYTSTLGLALWNFSFEILFISIILWDLIAKAKRNIGFLSSFNIGFLLFLSWFSRPSAIIYIVVYSSWFIYKNRSFKSFIPILSGMLIPFILFAAWSLYVYESLVPPYYDPFFWEKVPKQFSLLESILLVLFSPARGLLIFSPFLFIILPIGIYALIKRKTVISLFAFIVFALYVVLIANQSNWWGGWCFGSRLLTDALPFLFVIVLISIEELNKLRKATFKEWLSRGLIFFTVVAIYIHTFQGLYNGNTFFWNGSPAIDTYIKYYAWNWNYMPFLASEKQLSVKEKDFNLRIIIDEYVKKLDKRANVLFYKENDVDNFLIIDNLNKSNRYKNINLLSSIKQVEYLKLDSFYAPFSLQWDLDKMADYRMIYPKSTFTLGEYVRNNKNNHIILVIKDEGSTALSTESKELFKEMGSQLDSLKFQQGYVGIFKNGKLISESFELEKPAEIRFDRPNWYVYVKSIGMKNGNVCEIEINSISLQIEQRGFQVIEVNENGEIQSKQYFDTFCHDGPVTDLLLLKNKKFVN